jgi:hypothetical protein
MDNQFKRMQKLAGLITEGEAAYEYEKGKEAGEKKSNYQKLIDAGYSENAAEDFADEFKQGGVKVPQKVKDILTNESVKSKMKKSELKKQIKEMILAEIDIDLSNTDSFYDPVYEAKKKKKDEEVEDVEVDANIDMGDGMDMGTEMDTTPVPAASDVQKELMDALEAAKASGDEKLIRQIGNALTYFTRSQVSKEENPPSMNEGIEDTDVSEESYERMNNLVNQNDYRNFIDSATNIMNDLIRDGFEAQEGFYYLYTRLTAEV